jgi:hypothetical protein
MFNGCFHCGQSSVIGEFPLAVLAPVTLYALKRAKLDYVWRLAVFTLLFYLTHF